MIDARPTQYRVCSRCKEEWPLTLEFFRLIPNRRTPRRWDTWCRACWTEATRHNKRKAKMLKQAEAI